jgi:hypothetical protein
MPVDPYAAIATPVQAAADPYASIAQPIQPQSATPLQPYDPAKFGHFTSEANYPQWAAIPPKAGPYTKPGEYEAWTGAHLSPKEALEEAARGPAMGAATVAPMLTGGASLPVQSGVMGLAGAAQSKLSGGSNEESLVSGGIGAALPFAGPVLGKLNEILNPNAMKEAAGGLLQSVAHDANKIPVQLDNAGDAALKLMDWQKKTQLGPTLNKFLNRITNPKLGPLTYQEGRDFYSLLGNMSADEKLKMAAPIKYQLQELVSGLKQDIGSAADQVGRAADYYKGMGDYAKAMRLQEWYQTAKAEAIKAGKIAIPAGAGGYAVKRAIEVANQ